MYRLNFLTQIFTWIPFTAVISLYVLTATTSYTLHHATTVFVPLCGISIWTSTSQLCLMLEQINAPPTASAVASRASNSQLTFELLDQLLRDEIVSQSPRYSFPSHRMMLRDLRKSVFASSVSVPYALPVALERAWNALTEHNNVLVSIMANTTVNSLR